MNQFVPVTTTMAPALVFATGNRAAYRFLEFLTAQVRNPHDCGADARAVCAICL